jgi:uracil DNA glycosylase
VICRDELLHLFGKAAAGKGWVISADDLPEKIEGDFCPRPENIFKALELIGPKEVNFLIVGLDPYYSNRLDRDEPVATGLAFAVASDDPKIPQSLRKILTYLLRAEDDTHRDLLRWSQEHGVLLLNAALTVPLLTNGLKRKDVVGKHLKLWSRFTTKIVRQVMATTPSEQIVALGIDAREALDNALRPFTWCMHPAFPVKDNDEFGFRQFCLSTTGERLALQSTTTPNRS